MTGSHQELQPLVLAEGISKNYHRVQGLALSSITVHKGECVALAGPSGSGKTTLLSMLAGIDQPDQGQIFIEGRDLSRLNPGKELSQLVGLIHQQFDLVQHLPVVHNVLAGRLGQWSLFRSIISLLWPQDLHLAQAALFQLGIGDKINERTSHLSGGEQQRVVMARLMVQSPQLILADEPVASLDPALAEETLRLLTEMVTSSGKTLIVSLHSPYLIRKYCSRVIGLRRGQVDFDLPTAQLSEPMLDSLYELDAQPREAAPEVP